MEGVDDDVRALLARANLHKLRGQWREAVAQCTEAIQKDPTNAAAHGLLGEVYEAQGAIDKALHCYGMAVDQAPDNAAWRERLQKLARRKQASLKSARPVERPHREPSEPMPRERLYLLVGVGGVLALTLGIGAGVAISRRGQERKPNMIRIDAPSPKPIVIAAPPTPAPAASPTAPTPAPSPSPSPDAARQNLTIAGASSATFDPQTGAATVTMAYLVPQGKEPAEVREYLLRQAVTIGRTVLQAAPSAQTIAVRLDSVKPGSATPEAGFFGEASAAGLGAIADPETADVAALTGAFTSLQWAPSLAGGGNSAPTQ